MISSLLSSWIRKFNTSGWFWKINKRNQLKHISSRLANLQMFWRHIQWRERKIFFFPWDHSEIPSGGDRVTHDPTLEYVPPSRTVWMWPAPPSSGHIPLRSFLTTPTAHNELLPQFPCLYVGHLHFLQLLMSEMWSPAWNFIPLQLLLTRGKALQCCPPKSKSHYILHASASLQFKVWSPLVGITNLGPLRRPLVSSHLLSNSCRSSSLKTLNSAYKEPALVSGDKLPTFQSGWHCPCGSPPHSRWPCQLFKHTELLCSADLHTCCSLCPEGSPRPPAPPLSTSFGVSQSGRPDPTPPSQCMPIFPGMLPCCLLSLPSLGKKELPSHL